MRSVLHLLYRLPKKFKMVCSNYFDLSTKKKFNTIFCLIVNGTANKVSVWSLSVDDDDELEDENNLLDESDLIKPDKSTLIRKCHERKLLSTILVCLRIKFVIIGPDCETSGKRKACKNCSCGFAEELEKESKAAAPTSSCGSVCILMCLLFI